MTRCLYGKPAFLALMVEPYALVDNILIAALEAVMLASATLYEGSEAV